MKEIFRAHLGFATLLVLTGILAVMWLSTHDNNRILREEENIRAQAERDIAYVLHDTGQLLSNVDLVLKTLLDTAPRAQRERAWTPLLQNTLRNTPYLRSISLVDDQNIVIASTTADNIGLVLDPKNDIPFASSPGGVLHIGPPHTGRDLADGQPQTDNGRGTPDQGFVPISYTAENRALRLVATLNLNYLIRQVTDILGATGARVSLLRHDGLRLFDTRSVDASLLMAERELTRQWQYGDPGKARILETVDGHHLITVCRLHGQLPIGAIWTVDREQSLANIRAQIQRQNVLVLLLVLIAMSNAVIGYLLFRRANRREHLLRIQAEAHRRTLETSFNACSNAAVVTDSDGVIEWVNPSFAELTGYTATEAIGQRPGSLIKSGLQGNGFYRQMWQTLRSGHVWRGELVNRRKDGTLYDERMTISPVNGTEGSIQHFIAIKEDFTQHKAEREQLEIANVRLRTIVNNFPGAVIMEDPHGRIALVNPYALELLGIPSTEGYTVEQPLQPLTRLLSLIAEDSMAFVERVEELRERARPFYNEEIRFKDGRWMERDFIPIRHHDTSFGFLHIYRDISQRKRHAHELWQMATTDPLTGIPNRRAFFECLDHERNRISRYQTRAAILMLDIDYFKRINDTYGHAAGDAMLCHIVGHVRELLRESDSFGRLGGEEFGILLPETSLEGARDLSERIRLTLEQQPLNYNNTTINVTTSIGITIMDASDNNVDRALSRADHALYSAKHKGRNRVEIA